MYIHRYYKHTSYTADDPSLRIYANNDFTIAMIISEVVIFHKTFDPSSIMRTEVTTNFDSLLIKGRQAEWLLALCCFCGKNPGVVCMVVWSFSRVLSSFVE